MKGIVFNIKHFAVHDGPGIRQTIFLKGCPLNCWWCHNPESQSFTPSKRVKQKWIDGESTVSVENIGYGIQAESLLADILKDRIFYEESNGGVTFSGGEPLAQAHFLKEILQLCKKEDIHTAIDTTGYCPPKTFKEIASLTDLFLFDLKLADNNQHQYFTGVSIKPILENLFWLDSKKANVRLRFPMIPGITATRKNKEEIKKILLQLKHIDTIDILPYHANSREKYKQLGLKNRLQELKPPSLRNIEKLRKEFAETGFSVRIGG